MVLSYPWPHPGTGGHGQARGQAWHWEGPFWQASGGPTTSHLHPSPGSAPLREDGSLEIPHGLLLMAEFPG